MTDTEGERINAICEVAGVTEIDDLSDGFHTFRQLAEPGVNAESMRMAV